MTERLYYNDAYLAEFDAIIVRVMAHDGRPAVVLDRTAFYPTSAASHSTPAVSAPPRSST